jgi:predicted transcriptional regulator
MKPQDVLLALIMIGSNEKLTQSELAKSSHLSSGEVNNAIRRLTRSHLLDPISKEIRRSSLLEFILHGIKYSYPTGLGAAARGIPTAWGHKLIKAQIASKDTPVWPSVHGDTYGPSILPLYKNAVNVALKNKNVYNILALIDCIRIGKSREKSLAQKLLKELILCNKT